MIDAPYVHASRIPFFLSLLRFKKKLTVIGIIGHTQGVNNANNPPRKPVMNIYIQDMSSWPCSSPKACKSLITGFQRSPDATAG